MVKMLVQFFRQFSPNKDQCPARESGQCLAWVKARQYWIGIIIFVYYYMSVSQAKCLLYRWQDPDDEYRYEWFIPVDASKKSIEAGEGQRCKGALSYAYDFNVHCFVGHLRRVHASNPAMEVETTSSSGTKAKVIVKAADPLAKTGSLYYYHSKTKMYGDWFFWTWYQVLVPTYQNILPMLNATTMEELDLLMDCMVKM